jgi:hypothetical protein
VLSKDSRGRLRFWSEGVGLLDCRDSVSNDDLRRMNVIAGGRCQYMDASQAEEDCVTFSCLFP